MNSTEMSKADLGVREDHTDEVRLSAMYSAMSKMPSEKMKVDVISRCGGVMSSAGRPRTDEPALLPCENPQAHWAFLRDIFRCWIPQKSLQSVDV